MNELPDPLVRAYFLTDENTGINHRVTETTDTRTGEVVVRVSGCGDKRCRRVACREQLVATYAAALAHKSRYSVRTDLVTVKNATPAEVEAVHRAMPAAFGSRPDVATVVEPHKGWTRTHGHSLVFHTTTPTRTDAQALSYLASVSGVAVARLHLSRRTTKHGDPAYLFKEFLGHPVQHLERNGGRLLFKATKGLWVTPETSNEPPSGGRRLSAAARAEWAARRLERAGGVWVPRSALDAASERITRTMNKRVG